MRKLLLFCMTVLCCCVFASPSLCSVAQKKQATDDTRREAVHASDLLPVADPIGNQLGHPDVDSVISPQCGGEVIILPPGDFAVRKSIELDGQMLIGIHGKTRLHPETGITAIIIRSPPGISRRWNEKYYSDVKSWAGVKGVHIIGTGQGQGQVGIKTQGACDQVEIASVTIQDCDGGLLLSKDSGVIRESAGSFLVGLRCGHGAIPALGIFQPYSKFGDGANCVYFDKCRLVYSYGPAVLIRNDEKDDKIRNIRFRDCFFHMLPADAVKRFPLVVCEGQGPIAGLMVDGYFRGDDSGKVPAIKLGKATGTKFIGTFHGKAGSFGTVLVP